MAKGRKTAKELTEIVKQKLSPARCVFLVRSDDILGRRVQIVSAALYEADEIQRRADVLVAQLREQHDLIKG
jgi:hypothetical protein